MNMNKMARTVTLIEGGSIEISIAQVKEVLKIFLQQLAKESDEEVIKLVKRYR